MEVPVRASVVYEVVDGDGHEEVVEVSEERGRMDGGLGEELAGYDASVHEDRS